MSDLFHGVLVADTVQTVDLGSDDGVGVEVLNRGDDAIYFRVDGDAPGVAAEGSHVAPPHSSATVDVPTDRETVVKLVSSGTPAFSLVVGERVNRTGSAPAGEAHAGEVGGRLAVVGVEFTRPADVNAYAAKDVIADSVGAPTVLTFANLARIAGGSGYIAKGRLVTDKKDVTAARVRLHLFHTAPAAIADNAPYTVLYANKDKRVGYIDFGYLGTEDAAGSTAAYASVFDARLPFVCAPGDRNLYGVPEALDAIAAVASGQKFYVELTADLN